MLIYNLINWISDTFALVLKQVETPTLVFFSQPVKRERQLLTFYVRLKKTATKSTIEKRVKLYSP